MNDENTTPPNDVVPMNRPKRPTKETVRQLLEAAGDRVPATTVEMLEDIDGFPAGVKATRTNFSTSLTLLGWTQAEYDDPAVTE